MNNFYRFVRGGKGSEHSVCSFRTAEPFHRALKSLAEGFNCVDTRERPSIRHVSNCHDS